MDFSLATTEENVLHKLIVVRVTTLIKASLIQFHLGVRNVTPLLQPQVKKVDVKNAQAPTYVLNAKLVGLDIIKDNV
jgi:hypothetical protein